MPPRPDRSEFRRVRPEGEKEKHQGPENEIRVTAKGSQRSYVSNATNILNGENDTPQSDTIKINGMGAAIFSVVNVAEILKHRVAGLHQITETSSETVVDEYEAVSKDKENVNVERKVSAISITLSKTPLDTKHPGYQAPLPEDQMDKSEELPRDIRPRGGRGGYERGGRGGRGNGRGGRGGRGGSRGGRGGRGN